PGGRAASRARDACGGGSAAGAAPAAERGRMDELGWFRTAVDGDGTLVLRAGGQWRVATAASLDPALRRLDPAGAQAARIDLEAVTDVRRTARDLVGFFGLICLTLLRLLPSPRRLRFTALVAHMEQTGVNAIPIVGLLAFLIGVVFAYQGADQLRRFGAEIYTV